MRAGWFTWLDFAREMHLMLSALTAFRAAVDALMPGRFAWLTEDSLHCTVRPLR